MRQKGRGVSPLQDMESVSASLGAQISNAEGEWWGTREEQSPGLGGPWALKKGSLESADELMNRRPGGVCGQGETTII